jgi:curved DNA-binding protein CbpA
MNRFTDYYALLKVKKDASKDEIKRAFMEQARIWYPDKATSDEEKKHFTKIYGDLQQAYKILSNDETRKVYQDSQQATIDDFRRQERDTGYSTTDKFTIQTESGVKFDREAFATAFYQTRDSKDQEAFDKAAATLSDTPVTENDYNTYLQQRLREREELDTKMIDMTAGKRFDRDQFNMAFDFMKAQQPAAGGLQEYHGDPMAMFSSGGLVEDDRMSGLTFGNGVSLSTYGNIDSMVSGVSNNPTELKLDQFQPTGVYGYEPPMMTTDIQSRMDAMIADRERLLTMDKSDYSTEPSEIEKLYAPLFAPMVLESLPSSDMVAAASQTGTSESGLAKKINTLKRRDAPGKL